MLLTGKYPISNGVVTNCCLEKLPYGVELKDTERWLTDVLHDAGYHQGYIGKFHLHLPKKSIMLTLRDGTVNPANLNSHSDVNLVSYKQLRIINS
jgi:arylsulfatase A-like enzyme